MADVVNFTTRACTFLILDEMKEPDDVRESERVNFDEERYNCLRHRQRTMMTVPIHSY